MNVRMWQHRGDRRPTWRLLARARRRVGRPGRGRDGLQRIRPRPAGRTARDPGRDRGAAAHGRDRWPAATPWSPAGRRMSRSTRCAISPTAAAGSQGHAIAAALAALGARVTLVSGPVAVPDPPGVAVRHVETAAQMLAACQAALPADVAVCAAAVADWRVAHAADGKIEEEPGAAPPEPCAGAEPGHPGHAVRRRARAGRAGGRLRRRNRRPDGQCRRPSARAKAATGSSPTMSAPAPASWAATENEVHLVTADGAEDWPRDDQDGGRAGGWRPRIAEALA